MDQHQKTVTREQLYQEVWRTPLSKLATAWGTTIAALVKACDTMDVPRPEAGHWQALRHGWQIDPPVLPPAGTATPPTAILKPPQKQSNSELKGQASEPCGTETAVAAITVPENLDGAHPIVRRTRKLLKAAQPDSKGMVEPPWREEALCVRVSLSQMDRALRILDAIVQKVVERGGRFKQAKDSEAFTLYIDEESVWFRVYEGQQRYELTEEERKKRFFFARDKWGWKGTGLLKFEIKSTEYLYKERRWEEGKRLRLEDKVGEIIEALMAAGPESKQSRIRRAEEKKRCEEQRQREQQEYFRQQLEAGHRRRLEETADLWAKAKRLRSFIWVCERILCQDKGGLPADSWEMRWLVWARKHADQVDPLQNGYLESERKRLTAASTNDGVEELEDGCDEDGE